MHIQSYAHVVGACYDAEHVTDDPTLFFSVPPLAEELSRKTVYLLCPLKLTIVGHRFDEILFGAWLQAMPSLHIDTWAQTANGVYARVGVPT